MVHLDEVRKYYDRRYEDSSVSGRRRSQDYRIFFSKLKRYGNLQGKMLDVGCGTGNLFAENPAEELQTCGLDVSLRGLIHAKRTNPASDFVAGQGEYLPFQEGTFDIVTCLGSLEHFLSMDDSLGEMKRVARPGGLYCFLVPNRVHYRPDRKSRFLIRKVEGTVQSEVSERLFSYDEWKEIFHEHGFRIRHVFRDRYFQKGSLFKNVVFTLWLLFLPWKYTYQFGFICDTKS